MGIKPILCIVYGNTILQFDTNANVDAGVNEALVVSFEGNIFPVTLTC